MVLKALFGSSPGCRGLGAGCAAVCASNLLCMAARVEAERSLRCSRGGQRCASSAGLHALYDSLKVVVCALYDSTKGVGMLHAIAVNQYEHTAFNMLGLSKREAVKGWHWETYHLARALQSFARIPAACLQTKVRELSELAGSGS